VSASASDVSRAIVFATVAGDRREARDHGGLLGRHGADLVQSGDQRDRGDRSDGGNRGENIKTPGEDGITGDRALDLDIEVGDRTSGKPTGGHTVSPQSPSIEPRSARCGIRDGEFLSELDAAETLVLRLVDPAT